MARDRVTSVRIRDGLLKEARVLAILEGSTFRALVEELLEMAVGGAKLAGSVEAVPDEEVVEELLKMSRGGANPLVIVHEKTAVEIVREGRGD